jgi:hypothetical protein
MFVIPPRRLHLLTKHRVFSGPGFLVAQEIGDAAHGGQVAVSHDAWLELRNNMDQVSRRRQSNDFVGFQPGTC